jgi:uncharacterized coiled-coil DUF342 family protein
VGDIPRQGRARSRERARSGNGRGNGRQIKARSRPLARDASTGPIRIAQVGTFDVENFGDLLFPLLAQEALTSPPGETETTLFSYRAKSRAEWPYEVRPLQRLIEEIDDFDLVLVGGGDLIRFDKEVAEGYAPEDDRLHHPTAIWMAPTMLAAARGIPVAWNAVGVPADVPDWARGLTESALGAVSYLSVRDSSSADKLRRVSPDLDLEIAPDTAFGARKLLPKTPSKAFKSILSELGISGRYLVLQSSPGLAPFAGRLEPGLRALQAEGISILELPIGPIHGDASGATDVDVETVSPADWPPPRVLAEVIARAAGAIGVSMHMAIVASVHGVPTLRPASLAGAKQLALRGLPGVTHWRVDGGRPIELPFERESTVASSADGDDAARVAALDAHWEKVLASAGGSARPQSASDALLALPGQLEQHADQLGELASALELADRDRTELASRLEQLKAERQHVADQAAMLAEFGSMRKETERVYRETLDQQIREREAINQVLHAERKRQEELWSSIRHIEAERESLRQTLGESTADNTRVREALEKHQNHVAELESRIAAMSGDLAHLAEHRDGLQAERDSLEELLQANRADREHLGRELKAVGDALAEREASLRELRTGTDLMRAESAALVDRAEAAHIDRDHLRAQLDALAAEHAELQRVAVATENWLRQLEGSRSWRLTSPLRAVTGKLRRTFRRVDLDEAGVPPSPP